MQCRVNGRKVMIDKVSDEPHSTDHYTGDEIGLFTTTTTGTTTVITTVTTTTTTFQHNHYQTDYDEGTIHYAIVVSSLVVFVGLLCGAKSIGEFVRSSRRREQRSNGSVRPSSSFSQWFSDDPPPYPGKYSRTNINYLPSYESAIKIANALNQTTSGYVTIEVADTEPISGLPEANNDSGVIMFTVPEYTNSSSEPTRSSEFEHSNENIETAYSSWHAGNLVDDTCSEKRFNGSLENEINVREVTTPGNRVTVADETSAAYR